MYSSTDKPEPAYAQIETTAEDEVSGVSSKRQSSGRKDIALNAALLILPMLLFTTTILGLVYYYRVQRQPLDSTSLQYTDTNNEFGAIYVKLSATYLIFIASWSSSIAPVLTAAALSLASYPAARSCLKNARSQQPKNLYTPFQLTLALTMINGGRVSSLWHWLKYTIGWRHKRQSQATGLTGIAAVAICTTALGILVFLADTWLHVSTQTVNFVDVQSMPDLPQYGFALSENCTFGNNSIPAQLQQLIDTNGSCSVNYYTNGPVLVDGSTTLSVLNDISDSITISFFSSDLDYVYLGIHPSSELASQDYTATTYGAQTQCRPISTACNLNAFSFVATDFNCSPVFKGDLSTTPWQMQFFTDEGMLNNNTLYGVSNPYYMGWAALINPNGGGTLVTGNGNGGGTSLDPEIIVPMGGGLAFVITCNTTIFDVEYDSVNGTIARFDTQLSNDSVTNIAQVTTELMTKIGSNLGNDPAKPGYLYLAQAANIASFSDTAQELADKLALAYSMATVSMLAGAVQAVPALQAQTRVESLVAKVMVAPLFALVLANLLFALLGLVLMCIAMGVTNGDVKNVQSRLNITGLIADRFEGSRADRVVKDVEDLFEESEGQSSIRVGIMPSVKGGSRYYVWQPEDK